MTMRRQSTWIFSAFLSFWVATGALGLFPVRGAARNTEVDDLLGTWKLTYTSPDGKARECVIALSWQGSVLRGDYWDGKTTRLANNVGVERGELSFGVDGKHLGRVYTLTYKGRRAGDGLRGAVHWKYAWASGSFDFVGKRLAGRVTTMRGCAGPGGPAAAPRDELARAPEAPQVRIASVPLDTRRPRSPTHD
jgi:hypothetical protein